MLTYAGCFFFLLLEDVITLNREMKRILNINYAGIQGAYWMCFGVISIFASVLLLDRGYSNADIGMVFAVGNDSGCDFAADYGRYC